MKRERLFVLGTGGVVGMLLTATGVLLPPANELPGNVLARVNSKAIAVRDVDFALDRLAGDGETGMTRDERIETLNFLIDQELLVQRGVEIGLIESDRTVRKAMAMAMIDMIVAEVLKHEPTEKELHAFYQSHQAVFTSSARVQVQRIYFSGNGGPDQARIQAEQALAVIASGLSFADAQRRYGNEDGIPIPEVPLPPHVLLRYFGPTLTSVILALKTGEISPPVKSLTGYYLLRLVERQPEQLQPYRSVRQEVKAEYVRRRRDEALQHYLDELRAKATIALSPQAPG